MDDWDAVSDAAPKSDTANSWDAVSSPSPKKRKSWKPLKLSLPWRFLMVALVGLVILTVAGSGIWLMRYVPAIHISGPATPINANGTQAASPTATFATPENTPDATATVQADTTLADATATVTAEQTLYTQVTSGTLAFADPLTDNSNGWPVISGKDWSCGFTSVAYHQMESQSHTAHECYLNGEGNVSNNLNFAWQAQLNIVNGDNGGLMFSPSANNYYLADISSGGSYLLYKSVNKQGKYEGTGVSSAIHTTGQANVLTVIMDKGVFSFFVNGQYMASTPIGSYSKGIVFLSVDDVNQATDVAFSNVKEWVY
jgi:hypothetical protein